MDHSEDVMIFFLNLFDEGGGHAYFSILKESNSSYPKSEDIVEKTHYQISKIKIFTNLYLMEL